MVLFCHSMYDMKPKRRYIEKALKMLVTQPEDGMVVIFHRDGSLDFDGLVCHQTASFPSGLVRLADKDSTLNAFAPFIAGYIVQDMDTDNAFRVKRRAICRDLGRHEDLGKAQLVFSSPEVMVAFTQHAARLSELTAQVPLAKADMILKSQDARLHRPATIVRPAEIRHIQQCIQWALKYNLKLTVLCGGHSDHCVWSNVVTIDMTTFNQVHILTSKENRGILETDLGPKVLVKAGCKIGDVIQKAMEAGLTVPLGARPSVGAGSWLQGGIGHTSRLHGLSCDNIEGAVVIGVDSYQIFYVGYVPSQYRPSGAVRPENEEDLLWAIKSAGTNVGVVVSVIFTAYAAPTCLVRSWVIPVKDDTEALRRLHSFDEVIAKTLPRNSSADAYLYCEADQLQLGVTLFETSAALDTPAQELDSLCASKNRKVVDGVSYSIRRCTCPGCTVDTAWERPRRSSVVCF